MLLYGLTVISFRYLRITGVDRLCRKAKVEVHVRFLDLLVGDADVVHCLGYSGVTEDLLKQQELTGIVVGHQHLVIPKCLSQ